MSIKANNSILRSTFFAQFIAFVISSLSQTIGSLADGNIIGQFLGTDSIATFGIVNPLLTTFSVVRAIVSTGSRTRYTRLIGEGKKKDAQSLFSLSCILSVGFAALLMVIHSVFMMTVLYSTPSSSLSSIPTRSRCVISG